MLLMYWTQQAAERLKPVQEAQVKIVPRVSSRSVNQASLHGGAIA
jgi:hypothetical protein